MTARLDKADKARARKRLARRPGRSISGGLAFSPTCKGRIMLMVDQIRKDLGHYLELIITPKGNVISSAHVEEIYPNIIAPAAKRVRNQVGRGTARSAPPTPQ